MAREPGDNRFGVSERERKNAGIFAGDGLVCRGRSVFYKFLTFEGFEIAVIALASEFEKLFRFDVAFENKADIQLFGGHFAGDDGVAEF